MRDHHAFHAARGAGHVWMAAIVTGVALVLTGALAFTTVQAKEMQRTVQHDVAERQDRGNLMRRLDAMEKTLGELREVCAQGGAGTR